MGKVNWTKKADKDKKNQLPSTFVAYEDLVKRVEALEKELIKLKGSGGK